MNLKKLSLSVMSAVAILSTPVFAIAAPANEPAIQAPKVDLAGALKALGDVSAEEMVASLLAQYPEMGVEIFSEIAATYPDLAEAAMKAVMAASPDKAVALAEAAAAAGVSSESITTAALLAGADPTVIATATAAGNPNANANPNATTNANNQAGNANANSRRARTNRGSGVSPS
jgi:hypothetical protein